MFNVYGILIWASKSSLHLENPVHCGDKRIAPPLHSTSQKFAFSLNRKSPPNPADLTPPYFWSPQPLKVQPLQNNFQFSCCNSIKTSSQAMLILIFIDIQYLQDVAFRFKKDRMDKITPQIRTTWQKKSPTPLFTQQNLPTVNAI